MPEIIIDGLRVAVEEGATVLDAARRLGIPIPALCSVEGCRAETSCMVCVVRVNGMQDLLPSCATRATEGMVVESETDEIKLVRRTALDLLLGEHVGDCEAPCQRACPAHMNIPLMIRQIIAGELDRSLVTVKRHIALPAVLGRICPAPCEKACRRASYDSAVSICLLKRFVADVDLAAVDPWVPSRKPASGKTVAIVGAGPTGLAAAYYLLQDGHACTIFDEHEAPGGMLRYGVSENDLPRQVLAGEIEVIRRLGAEFRMNTTVGKAITMEELEERFDAVVLAPGAVAAECLAGFGVELTEHGIRIARGSFQTSRSKAFAGGDAVQHVRLAVRAVAHGKSIAMAVGQQLAGEAVTGPKHRFDSRMGKLKDGEMEEFLKEADRVSRQEPRGKGQGFSAGEALQEARRCLHCDCRKADACRLRDWSDACGASQQRYAGPERPRFRKVVQHASVTGKANEGGDGLEARPTGRNTRNVGRASRPSPVGLGRRVKEGRAGSPSHEEEYAERGTGVPPVASVIYEPGKCIKCGLCVQVTAEAGERLGLTFRGRGFDVEIGVPFNESLADALEKTAQRCVEVCPTGALAHRGA